MSRHEFLQALHELLKPQVYLETGVQHGWSLQLSKAPISIGIDPSPLIKASKIGSHVQIYEMTSDQFFDDETGWIGRDTDLADVKIDFAFIDGMHLAEYAWRDFCNVERYSHDGTVVVFDDVLPYTTNMAAREMCSGDWTGDVWKVHPALTGWGHLTTQLVNTSPTGTLVVTGLRAQLWQAHLERPCFDFNTDRSVPDYVIDRRHAWKAEHVLENLRDRGFAK